MRFHRLDANAEAEGDLLLRDAFELPQDVDLPGLRRKSFNRLHEKLDFFPAAGVLCGTGVIRYDLEEIQIPYSDDRRGRGLVGAVDRLVEGHLEQEWLGILDRADDVALPH